MVSYLGSIAIDIRIHKSSNLVGRAYETADALSRRTAELEARWLQQVAESALALRDAELATRAAEDTCLQNSLLLTLTLFLLSVLAILIFTWPSSLGVARRTQPWDFKRVVSRTISTNKPAPRFSLSLPS